MSVDLSNAQTVAFRAANGKWKVVSRTKYEELFRETPEGRGYTRSELRSAYQLKVLEEFPDLESILEGATVFRAEDRSGGHERVWVLCQENKWGAVNVGATTYPYPTSTYTTAQVELFVRLDTVVPLVDGRG